MSETTDPNPHDPTNLKAEVPGTPSSSGSWWGDANGEGRQIDEPTLSGEPTLTGAPPTAQVPGAPPLGHPPTGAPPMGPPPGAAGYPPPGYPPPPGFAGAPNPWGSAPWAAPPWQWPAQPQPAQSPTRFGSVFFTAIIAAAVGVAAVLGVVIGHALWKNNNAVGFTSPTTVPQGNGGLLTPQGGSSSPGSNSSGSGAPPNAASIAKNVDPGLVDVNTSISYQGLLGAGTGEVLTPNGEILTNNHVIEEATKISVTDVGNGRTYNATVVGYDRTLDIAVLQLSGASGLQTVSSGDSSKLAVGQGVVAIGNANGAGGTPSYAGGSVTGLNRSITASDEADGTSEQLSGLIQTNADIVSGDSGGPLVNSSGQMIGVDTASAGTGGFQFQAPANQGFAIPVNEAISTARKIEAGTSSSTIHIGPTAFLGVEVQPSGANGSIGSGTQGPSTPGALIVQVISGGPADQGGLQAGDTITAVDGHAVTSADSLTNVMLGERAQASVPVQYVDQSGQQHTATVTLGSGPSQ